jgi:large subunit ribosomal protein L25
MATKTRIKLEADVRTTFGKQNRALRRKGILPGRVFGHGDPLPVQVDGDAFIRMIGKHQTTGIIDLAIAGQKQLIPVLVRHISHEPATNKIEHIDFFRVAMGELLTAKVTIHFVGESPAVKNNEGTLLPLLDVLDINALPDNLPQIIEVDISSLTSADSVIHAGDVKLPAGVVLLTPADEPIVKVQPPRGGEAATEAAATAEGETPAESAS